MDIQFPEEEEQDKKLSQLNSIIEGKEFLEKNLKLAKHNSSNLFQKRNKMNLKEEDNKEKPKQEEDKKETNNNPPISLLSDIIKDKTDNKPLLSDMISGNKEEDKKEDKKEETKEPPKKKEMKKFLTDSVLKTKSSAGSLEDRRMRMSKRLNKAKEQAKKKEEGSKYKKSENIAKRASVIESKISAGSIGSAQKNFEKIKEENEEKDD